jgi:hypothetical protein
VYGLRIHKQLLILDFTTGFFDAYLFQATGQRLGELLAQIPRSDTAQTYNLHALIHYGVSFEETCIFCNPLLAAQGRSLQLAAGTSTIEPLPDIDVNNLVPLAVKHVAAGSVQLSVLAVEKGKTCPLGGCLDYRPGRDIKNDALRAAVTWAIIAAFERSATVHKLELT